MKGAYGNESPAPRADTTTIRRIPHARMALTALPMDCAKNVGGLTGLAQGESEERLLASVLIIALQPAIADSMSLAFSGIPVTIDKLGELNAIFAGLRTSATTSCPEVSAYSTTCRPVLPVAPSAKSFTHYGDSLARYNRPPHRGVARLRRQCGEEQLCVLQAQFSHCDREHEQYD